MDTAQRFSYSAMIVSPGGKSREIIAGQLSGAFRRPLTFPESGGEARRALMERDFDAVIVNSPLRDESGVDLALQAAAGGASVMLFCKAEIFDEICSKTENSGVLVLAKPFSAILFRQAQNILLASRQRVRAAEKECSKLRAKMDEIKSVDFAKCLLIEFRGMSEPEAHRYIEKRAMDDRVSKKEVAETVIKTYQC